MILALLAEAILKLLETDTFREHKGKAACSRARLKISLRIIVPAMHDRYQVFEKVDPYVQLLKSAGTKNERRRSLK